MEETAPGANFPTPNDLAQSLEEAPGTAADLRVSPRDSGSYTTDDGGSPVFGRIEGFIPLSQTLGFDLLFLEGRLLISRDNANLSFNALLGYRRFLPTLNRIFGGYIAFDNRETSAAEFSQIGMGIETLGDRWDLRLNGYIPIGDIRERTDSTLFDNGLELIDLRFQDRQLVGSGQQEILQVNACLGLGDSGAFEDPFSTVQEGIDATSRDGNGIVYVAIGDDSDVSAFTVPGGVQVLSTGPEQVISTNEFGDVQLPSSGEGNFSRLVDTVTVASSPVGPTVLSGFDITPPAGPGIEIPEATGDIEIRNNFDDSPGVGIELDAQSADIRGNVSISNNEINGASSGIGLYAEEAEISGNITISGNSDISGEDSGVYIDADNSTISGDIAINDNLNISGDGDDGVYIYVENSTLNGGVTISGNANIRGEADGVDIYAFYYSTISGGVTVSGNAISGEADGLDIYADYYSTISGGVTISGNTVNANQIGIYVDNYSYSEISDGVTIANNNVQVDGTEGAARLLVINSHGSLINGGGNGNWQ